MKKRFACFLISAVFFIFSGGAALSAGPLNPEMRQLLDTYLAEAGKKDPDVKAFSAEDGKKLFNSKRTHSVKKEERSCTTCHTADPRRSGKTPVGKVIEPMAPSVNKERFTDPKKVEKWFKRNCEWVLERECTPMEKGDFITFMITQ